jgi:hypothetical protein
MLRLLLDEHISPRVAKGLRRSSRGIAVHSLTEWEAGNYLGQDDAACLREAANQRLTLVTYDRRTIPPLLKSWAEAGMQHGGVIFVDEKTTSPADIGGLVRALRELALATRNLDWTNRVFFLRH